MKKNSVGVSRKGIVVKDQGFVPYNDARSETTPNVVVLLKFADRSIQMDWIMNRMKEPSSYAALGGVVVGVGVLLSQPIVIMVGMVGGVVGFLLKEKGVF